MSDTSITDAAPAAAAPLAAPNRDLDLLPYMPFILLIACLVARGFSVAAADVDPIIALACLLVDPRRLGGRS